MEYEGVLPDGTQVLFRRIRPDDKDLLRRGFEMLSEASRYRRFFRQIDHLSAEQLHYLTEVDFENHYAWIAVKRDDPQQGLGVGRWIRIPSDPAVAESAITVIDAFHNQGLGSTLLWLLAHSGIEKGIKALRVWVQGENQPVIGLLGDFGVVPRKWEGGVSEIDIPLPGDVHDLDETPAKLLLRAVASGDLEAENTGPIQMGTRLTAADATVSGDSGGAPDRT